MSTKPSLRISEVAQGRRGHPFCGYIGDISEIGYIEEEFFLEGVAAKYRSTGELKHDGKWNVRSNGSAPFKTRMLVRRPCDPARFNGIVILEWLNVTVGYDTSTISPITDGIYNDGFVYIGVSCQRVGLEGYAMYPQGLKAWDPERYGSLSIPGDSISYDIFSQTGRALGPNRTGEGVDPLPGLNVKKVIATGASQSGGRLRTYINAIHLRDRVFDAFMPTIEFGMGFGFEDISLDVSVGLPSPERVFIRGRIRDDIDEPVFVVNSETESLLMYPSRQPDTARFRFWEVAGASHVPAAWDLFLDKLRARDQLAGMDFPRGSQVMWQPSCDAALGHLGRWITEGTEPPSAAPIEISSGDGLEVVRDQFGNALGGVRLPELEVPVAEYRAAIPALNAIEGLRGTTTPFNKDVLNSLYPDRNAYLSRVEKAAEVAEASGYIQPSRTVQYIEEARAFSQSL